MENFNIRKEEYLKNLEDSYIYEYVKKGLFSEFMKDPKNEYELSLANAILTYFVDSYELARGNIGKYNIDDYNNSFIKQIFVDVIKALKNNDTVFLENVEKYLYKVMYNPVQYGNYLFEYYSFIGFIQNVSINEDFVNLAEECGFDTSDIDLNDPFGLADSKAMKDLKGYFEKAENIVDINCGVVGKKHKFNIRVEKETEITIEAMDIFNELFENRNKKNNKRIKLELYK